MSTDARFEDGAEAPLALRAIAADDLPIVSSLCQDAVFPLSEITYDRKKRQFALLLNRFRWEDQPTAARLSRPFERVQSVLLIDDVLSVRTQGLDMADKDTVLALLSISFQEQNECGGVLELILSGDGTIAIEIDCIEVTLKDVTRPYAAPSGKTPAHPE